jgi:N6-adenosine-specific RNA methylase IME4
MPSPTSAHNSGIGRDTIYKMAVVRDKGVPELKEAVRRGDVNARTAKAIAEQPVNVQHSIISHASEITGCDRPRAFRVEATKALQRAKMAETAKANRALDTKGKTYDVIYADPPWQFDSELTGSSRAVENHYATMPTAEIAKLPVGALAAKNAILFLWTTDRHLLEAEQVLEVWGFTRRARMVWVKNSIGLGRFVRNRHEFLLIATRGDMPAPPTDAVPDSVLDARKTKHSAKPFLYAMIEKMTPSMEQRIELFARWRQPGWDTWGNQVDDNHGLVMRPPIPSDIILPPDMAVAPAAAVAEGAKSETLQE